jgi:hypothetical protein
VSVKFSSYLIFFNVNASIRTEERLNDEKKKVIAIHGYCGACFHEKKLLIYPGVILLAGFVRNRCQWCQCYASC